MKFFLKNKVLFLTLRVFSATGGIERVCRIAGKALYELGLQYGGRITVHAMYGNKDNAAGNKYFPNLLARDFGNSKLHYVAASIRAGVNSEIVILSHINLLLVGYLIKVFKPSVKIVLLAHGIEVWKRFPGWKRRMLKKVDLFLPVSHFTSNRLQQLNGLPPEKFVVLNNCLDPFLERPLYSGKPAFLLERYHLTKDHTILLTVARMVDTEHYKGYDKVLHTLPLLAQQYPQLRYLLVGKYDAPEKRRLDAIIAQLGIGPIVIFAGMVPEEELAAHFSLADIFVMPSEKEGFGIVFIEAMFYGKPVIAGNIDGSADALLNGELGLLVNPANRDELMAALRKMLDDRDAYLPDQQKLEQHFGYTQYKKKLRVAIGEESWQLDDAKKDAR